MSTSELANKAASVDDEAHSMEFGSYFIQISGGAYYGKTGITLGVSLTVLSSFSNGSLGRLALMYRPTSL